jgi:hypothetical protein
MGGVNSEDPHHNRDSEHSEENALKNAQSIIGNKEFTEMYIMAAPANAIPDPDQKPGKSCGHCRQLEVSAAKPEAKIYVMQLTGNLLPPDSFDGEKPFLLDPFKESDVGEKNALVENAGARLDLGMISPQLQAWQAWVRINELSRSGQLTREEIEDYVKTLKPHIVNEAFKTSPVTACFARCSNDGCAISVLCQDVAYLTRDALFGVVGNAITQFGKKNVRFDELHIVGSTLEPEKLMTFSEIEKLSYFTDKKALVHVYTPDGQRACYTFEDCIKARLNVVEGNFLRHVSAPAMNVSPLLSPQREQMAGEENTTPKTPGKEKGLSFLFPPAGEKHPGLGLAESKDSLPSKEIGSQKSMTAP